MSFRKFFHTKFRHWILGGVVKLYYRGLYNMNVDKTALVSLKARLDKTNPAGINIGAYTHIAFGATILAHDMVRKIHVNTYIGEYCFVGANAIILPGVRVGSHVIIGAGSVVTKDIPANCIAVGNPAKVIRCDVKTGCYGILEEGI